MATIIERLRELASTEPLADEAANVIRDQLAALEVAARNLEQMSCDHDTDGNTYEVGKNDGCPNCTVHHAIAKVRGNVGASDEDDGCICLDSCLMNCGYCQGQDPEDCEEAKARGA